MRPLIIEKTHTQHHSGTMKTYNRIKLQWFWPGMTGDIRRLIKTCEISQAAKNSKNSKSGTRKKTFCWTTMASIVY